MKTFEYSLKVWQTGVLVSPIGIVFFEGIQKGAGSQSIFFMFLFAVAFGIIFSFPSFLLLWLTSHVICNKNLNGIQQKLILSLTSIALTFLAFFIFQYKIPGDEIGFALIYASVIVAGIWVHKLRPANTRLNRRDSMLNSRKRLAAYIQKNSIAHFRVWRANW